LALTSKKRKNGNGNIFGTYEWANMSANFISGCKHDCKYCYSKEMAIRFGRKTAQNWKEQIIVNERLKKDFAKNQGTIMFPSSHDIHPDVLNESICFLNRILSKGNRVLIVTKPHLECVKEICNRFDYHKNKIMFRFTIGSVDSKVLKFWEPGAPDFEERYKSLIYAYHHGFQTSVSCEPMLDDKVIELVKKLSPYVSDYLWIGKANYLLRRLKINNADDDTTKKRANELIQFQTDEKIKVLYKKLHKNPKLKWKESIKKVVGIELVRQKGMDV